MCDLTNDRKSFIIIRSIALSPRKSRLTTLFLDALRLDGIGGVDGVDGPTG